MSAAAAKPAPSAAARDHVIPPKVAAAAAAGAGANSRAFQITARRQRMCDSRAVGIVEQLAADGCVTAQYLAMTLVFLSRQHYTDAVTERNLSGNCGFPLCASPLRSPGDSGLQAKQRYRIVASTRRVYDLTRRKCYCSDICFAQSACVHDRLIPETPLWLRTDDASSYSALSAAARMSQLLSSVQPTPGDPVNLDPLAEDLDKLLRIEAKEKEEKPTTLTTTTADPAVSTNASSISSNRQPSLAWLDKLVQPNPPQVVESTCDNLASQRATPEAAAFSIAAEWFTEATRLFLRKRLITKPASRLSDSSVAKDTVRLLGNEVATPLTSKEDKLSMDKADVKLASKSATAVKIVERIASSAEEAENQQLPRRMPPVDSASQATLRRRVVQEKLTAFVGSKAVKINGVSLDCISDDLRRLVDTFKLTRSNIALATPVWEILAWLTLLLLLRSRKDLRAAVSPEVLAAQADSSLSRHGSSLAKLLELTDRLLTDKTTKAI